MRYTLPPHIWLARVDDDIIVLDIRADRYARLGRVASQVFVVLTDNQDPSPDQLTAANKLAAAGLLVTDGTGRRVETLHILPPTASALEQSLINGGPDPGLVRCAFAVVGALIHLRILGLERTLRSARQLKRTLVTCRSCEHAIALAQAFARQRTAIPFGRSCLPDSLALFRLAIDSGIDTRLIIGVRDRPFAAHCWVETQGLVLTDALAPIRELTPILAI